MVLKVSPKKNEKSITWFHLHRVSGIGSDSRIAVTGGELFNGKGSFYLVGTELPFEMMEYFWRWRVASIKLNTYITMNALNVTE